MIRDGGADGVYKFTVAGLASYAVHEAHHHLLDADGTLPPTITAGPRTEEHGVAVDTDAEAEDRFAALERRVQQLEDEVAVLRLVNSWGPAVDTGSSEAAGALWDEAGVLESDLSHLEGPSAVVAMVESDGQQSLIRQGCAHVQSAPIVSSRRRPGRSGDVFAGLPPFRPGPPRVAASRPTSGSSPARPGLARDPQGEPRHRRQPRSPSDPGARPRQSRPDRIEAGLARATHARDVDGDERAGPSTVASCRCTSSSSSAFLATA